MLNVKPFITGSSWTPDHSPFDYQGFLTLTLTLFSSVVGLL